jgi:hypothetical protein
MAVAVVFMPSSAVFAEETAGTVDSAADTTATNNNDQSATAGDATNTPATDPTPPAPTSDTTPTSTDTTGPTSDTSTQPPATDASTEGCVNPNSSGAQPTGSQGSSSGVTDSTNSSINNNICSQANSGDASVTDNGHAGDATSGDAQSIATILNILQSITGLSGGNLATFIQNVYGDQFGDIYIDPATLDYLLNGGCSLCSNGGNGSINNNGQINNDIYLGANSGNADVSNNGSAGNATTGDATTLLNLVNIINSVIAANDSFIGIINIYGNLNGDILFPPDLLNTLFGSNGSSGGGGSPGNVDLDVNNNQNINNNVVLDATSGNATVSDNHHAGSATTGDASTNLTILNLTGNQVIGKNAILVFVNVLGKWVGMILNAPEGATSAALGNGSGSGCLCGGDLDATINNNAEINNNIHLSSQSGDASVIGNHHAGDATSGNATASANIVNIISSQLSFSDWFGILFINVFGTWTGSFGIDTEAGNTVDQPTSNAGGNSGGAGPIVEAAIFTSPTVNKKKVYYSSTNTAAGDQDSSDDSNKPVLGAFIGSGSGGAAAGAGSLSTGAIVAGLGSLCCFALLGMVERRSKAKNNSQMAIPSVVQPSF